MKPFRTLCLTFLAIFLTALPAFAGDPTGTWKIKAEGPKGRSIDSTLLLKWENNQLTGTIDNRAGQVEIANGQFTDEKVTFSVARKIRRRTITVNYTGTLEGDTIKGTFETKGRDHKVISLPWEAERSK